MKRLATLIVGTALAFGAHASIIVSGGSFTSALTPTDFLNKTGTLNFFNSDFGSLDSATLTLTAHTENQITLSLSAAAPAAKNMTGKTTVEMSYGSDVTSLNNLLVTNSPYLSLLSSTGTQLVNPNSSYVSPLILKDGTTTFTLSSAFFADLSKSGGGNFLLNCSSSSDFLAGGAAGNGGGSVTGSASCGASLEYTYTANAQQVPEPGALALVGIALAGLALARRKA